MTQPFRKTFLPPNKFYSAVDIPSSADEAGASSSAAPTPDAPADISDGDSAEKQTRKAGNMPGSVPGEELTASATSFGRMLAWDATTLHQAGVATGSSETEAAVSVRTAAASDLLQALGALSGTDLIHEIFAAKPKHFKLKHKRRLKLPPFAPDYEAMEAAMHDRKAPRLRADDPVWADASPLFLRGRT